MPEPQVPKPTPPANKHMREEWTRGTAMESAMEATYSPRCTHTVYLGLLRIRCVLSQQVSNNLILENAILDTLTPNQLLPDPMKVQLWDQVIISNGAIMFPIDKPAENK